MIQADLERVNLIFGGITAVADLIATVLGGWLGDRLAKRFSGAYFHVSAAGMLLAFPAMLYTPFPLALVFSFFAIFFLFFSIGPANTAIANVTKPAVRASAFAVAIFVMHALGMMLVAGLLWLRGARFLGPEAKQAARQ